MTFFTVYINALLIILIMMVILWIISILIRNVSIVDLFWGMGFVITSLYYYIEGGGDMSRKILTFILAGVWGLRLSTYITWRNYGKGEDFRYREFRNKYGEKRYWWISFFQTFLLQGVLMWLISAPLLGAQYYGSGRQLGVFDYIGFAFWFTGIMFEAGGDFQLARFRDDPGNKGKVLKTGFWRYTRHPNYFGDASVWWGFGFICLSAGSFIPVLGSVLMTFMIIRVSGVALLEKSLKDKKPEYREYIEKTSSFIPWFPKK